MSRLETDKLRASYDARFSGYNNLRDSDTFYAWVFRKLDAKQGKKILDVACGSGRLLAHAADSGLRTYGVDFSNEALNLERVVAPQAELILADGQFLPIPDGLMDYVTNLGSLEHFLDIDRGIQEIVRVMHHESTAAIFLPNAYYLADLIWWVWRKGISPSHKQLLERFAAFADWRELLEKNGLVVVQAYKYNFAFPRSQLDWEYYRTFPRKLLNLAISPVVPFNFSYSFLYICRKTG